MNAFDNAEKRRRVLELRKEGWTIREIARELHMSSRTVIRILREDSSKVAQEEIVGKAQEQQNTLQANYTKALRLFKEGKSMLDVTIELGVLAEETKRAFYDFQDINGLDNFRGVCEDIKPFVSALVTLWGVMRERGLGVKDALVAIEFASDRAKAEKELQDLTNKISYIGTQANLLENRIIVSKLQMMPDYRPPASVKDAVKWIVALCDQPNAKEPSADNHCSEDYKTTNKD
ncbi:hypothetical protein BH18THE2_BH18THE2_28260 [soil metagenome]